MAKNLRAVRLFFSTYYDSLADAIIGELEKRFGDSLSHIRSRVVPELHYVEIRLTEDANAEEVIASVNEVLEAHGRDGRVYGVKVYAIPPEG